MHHKSKATEKQNANMFAFNHTCLHFSKFANQQTIKEKCKQTFQGTCVIKNKRLCLMENKHSCNHIYVIIGLQTIKHTNNQTYKVTCYLVSKLTKKRM